MTATPLALPAAAAATGAVAPATGPAALAWLLIVIPAAGAAILLLAGRAADAWGHWLGLLAAFADAALGIAVLAQVLSLPADQWVMEVGLWRWFAFT